jgi:hypothetical protein
MNSKAKSLAIAFLFVLLNAPLLTAQGVDIKGQITSWGTYNRNQETMGQLGLRYIPEALWRYPLHGDLAFDVDGSFNANAFTTFRSSPASESSHEIKAYRLWLRFSSPRFEARFGLQKINFGSAMLIRPLMWFDRLDPRDPLQITSGVYGLLFRYYFLNNANVWLWGLYGNDDPKGWEVFPTQKKSIEAGGRFQTPFFNGELALTFHRRYLGASTLVPTLLTGPIEGAAENRIGLDGKWDYGVGLWVEASAVHKDVELDDLRFEKMATLGCDYTFGLGNGLHVLNEYFLVSLSPDFLGSTIDRKLSTISFDYPLSIVDQCVGIFYYDWQSKKLFRTLIWNRVLNNWSFHILGFWNPSVSFFPYQEMDSTMLFGKGFQIMVVFNH